MARFFKRPHHQAILTALPPKKKGGPGWAASDC